LRGARRELKMKMIAVSEIMLTLILTSMLAMVLSVKPVSAYTTVYIRANGSVDPSTAPVFTDDNVIYTFTDNIYDEIVIERNNIVVDGSGHTLQGQGIGYGFHLDNIENVTIKAVIIKSFSKGIMLNSSSFNNVSENTITDNWDGVNLSYSFNNTISGNNITANGWGVTLDSSHNNTISSNNITKHVYASESTPVGIQLGLSSNNVISGNNITDNYSGVHLYTSSFNVISGNNITNNPYRSLYLSESFNNTIFGNRINSNGYGAFLHSSSFNVVSENDIVSNSYGVELYWSSNNNTVSRNKITNSSYGFASEGGIEVDDGQRLYLSSNNTVSGNDVTNNHVGVKLYLSFDNIMYHNNFINNTQQVYDYSWDHAEFLPSKNSWNGGYPSGGNYWSDYIGTDFLSGSYQNVTGSDGIGDAPYGIDANNNDSYPLMAPYSTFDVGTWNDVAYDVDVISNSTVSDFYFNPAEGAFVRFNVTGSNGTVGFSRVAIPKNLLWTENAWVVLVDSEPIVPTFIEDYNCIYLYFTYNHSTKAVKIIGTNVVPEFPATIIVLIFMVLYILAVAFVKKKFSKRSKTQCQKSILSFSTLSNYEWFLPSFCNRSFCARFQFVARGIFSRLFAPR
jgi:parallel beta-helix repeat protein